MCTLDNIESLAFISSFPIATLIDDNSVAFPENNLHLIHVLI